MRGRTETVEQERLVLALGRPGAWPHPVDRVERIETHISWVLLCGEYAYKIKKAVDLGFLDFTTLDRRRFYCHEELRLNGRLAPELYLDVVPIAGTAQRPQVGGAGEVIEYAVKMKRFPQEALLSRMVERQGLDPGLIDQMIEIIADFHQRIPSVAGDSELGTAQRVRGPVDENFRQIRERVGDAKHGRLLDQIRQWSEREFVARRSDLRSRREQGFVRECHGDMHLGNMAWIGGRVLIFDGIEFNPALYWIDVMSEVAFLCMDLEDHGYRALAFRFLNGYLERTGDYLGLRVLPYYLAYRAMVRAKVASIRLQQETEHGEAPEARAELDNYLALALRYTQAARPALFITHGLSGSGKSTLSAPLVERLPAIRLRSDRERQRLFGRGEPGAGIEAGIYSREASARTYGRLAELAQTALGAGYSVLVDATFLRREDRNAFRSLAERLGAAFWILDFRAAPQILRQRVRARAAAGEDVSQADLEVLEHQLQTDRGLDADEHPHTIAVDTETITDGEQLYALLRSALHRR